MAEAFLFLRFFSAVSFLVVSNAAEPRFIKALQLILFWFCFPTLFLRFRLCKAVASADPCNAFQGHPCCVCPGTVLHRKRLWAISCPPCEKVACPVQLSRQKHGLNTGNVSLLQDFVVSYKVLPPNAHDGMEALLVEALQKLHLFPRPRNRKGEW